MPELFAHTTRNVEQDCLDMTELLNQRGWVIVNGVVRSISAGVGIYNNVEPGLCQSLVLQGKLSGGFLDIQVWRAI